MSFDLHFFSLPVPPEPAPLSASAEAKLGALMQRYGGPPRPDEYGFFFDLADGAGNIEFYAGKHDGGMLALRGVSDTHLAFVWDVMREMGWVILIPIDEEKHVLLTTGPADDLGMLSEMTGEIVVRVADGPNDIASAMSEPFESWAAWRDHIVTGNLH